MAKNTLSSVTVIDQPLTTATYRLITQAVGSASFSPLQLLMACLAAVSGALTPLLFRTGLLGLDFISRATYLPPIAGTQTLLTHTAKEPIACLRGLSSSDLVKGKGIMSTRVRRHCPDTEERACGSGPQRSPSLAGTPR